MPVEHFSRLRKVGNRLVYTLQRRQNISKVLIDRGQGQIVCRA